MTLGVSAERGLQIGPGKVIADKQQRPLTLFRQRIGEAVAEVQPGFVHAASPAGVGGGYASRLSLRYRDCLHRQVADKFIHCRANAAPRCHHEGFGEGGSRDRQLRFLFDCRHAGLSLRLVQYNCHECRSVDHDHFGRLVLASYKKSWLRAADGPGFACLRPYSRARSMAARRSAAGGMSLSGTRRTTSRPKRVRTTSSPASARRTSSVSWPLAWLTDSFMIGTLDHVMVQIKGSRWSRRPVAS